VFELIFKDPPPSTFIEIWQPASTPQHRFIPATTELIDTGSTEIDTYFGVALRKSRGSEKTDVYGTRVLWVDAQKPDSPQSCTFPPSIIVHSGGGWHLYWALTKWETNQELIEAANRTLMEDIDGDACFNVNRFLRVPGTRNTKYEDTRVQLRQQRPVAYNI
jgi:hypothetical protein